MRKAQKYRWALFHRVYNIAPVLIFQEGLYIDASSVAVVLPHGPLFIPWICNVGMDANSVSEQGPGRRLGNRRRNWVYMTLSRKDSRIFHSRPFRILQLHSGLYRSYGLYGLLCREKLDNTPPLARECGICWDMQHFNDQRIMDWCESRGLCLLEQFVLVKKSPLASQKLRMVLATENAYLSHFFNYFC